MFYLSNMLRDSTLSSMLPMGDLYNSGWVLSRTLMITAAVLHLFRGFMCEISFFFFGKRRKKKSIYSQQACCNCHKQRDLGEAPFVSCQLDSPSPLLSCVAFAEDGKRVWNCQIWSQTDGWSGGSARVGRARQLPLTPAGVLTMQELLIDDWQLVRVGRPRANATKKDDVLLRNKYFLTV